MSISSRMGEILDVDVDARVDDAAVDEDPGVDDAAVDVDPGVDDAAVDVDPGVNDAAVDVDADLFGWTLCAFFHLLYTISVSKSYPFSRRHWNWAIVSGDRSSSLSDPD